MSPDEWTPWDGWTPGDGSGDSMIDDRIRAVFDEPIVPLSPPPGTWESIQTDVTRRRRARRLLTAASAAAVLALFAGGLTWLGGVGGDGRPVPAPQATAATTPAPSASGGPTAGPTGPTDPTQGALVLPRGGPVPRGFVAVSATSADAGLVYALGTAPCRAAPCTSVVRSADGGRTWAGMPAPKAEMPGTSTRPGGPATPNTVFHLRFATPTDGWAFGGGLWQTHDGAATWQKMPIAGTVLDLATDGEHVWAVTTVCDDAPCPSGVEVHYGRAGDRRFTRRVRFPQATSYGVRLAGGGGTMALTVGGQDSQLYLAREDGTWSGAVTPCPPPGVGHAGELLAVAPPAEGDGGLVAFCGKPALNSRHVVTRRSTDGGRTWTGQGRVTVPGSTFSATAVTADVVLLASGNADLGGALLVSRDGGRTYATPRVGAAGGGWLWVGAAGGGRVLALPLVATGAVYLSTDAGASFVAQPIR
jgi:hypothetical protein